MRILFLHLSDIHLRNNITLDAETVFNDIPNVINADYGINDAVVIVITGDIVFSGTKVQYRTAKHYIQKLKDNIIENGNKNIYIMSVPGNHDMCFGEKDNIKSINEILKNHCYDSEISSERKYLKNYYNFCNELGILTCSNLYNHELLEINKNEEKVKINFGLLNNAFFSRKEDPYKGLLYLDDKSLVDMGISVDANISIVMSHHSFDYYQDAICININRLLNNRFSIAFLGHNHISTELSGGNPNSPSKCHILYGGCISPDGKIYKRSEFSILQFDSVRGSVKGNSYYWNDSLNIFSNASEIQEFPIRNLSKNDVLRINETFEKKLLHDEKEIISDLNISDIFEFPLLVKNTGINSKVGNDLVSMEDLINIIKLSKLITIKGGSGAGKTTLLKMLHINLVENTEQYQLFPIYIDAKYLHVNNSLIPNCIKTQYGDSQNIVNAYNRLAPVKKVLIIDNIDQLNKKQSSQLFDIAEPFFDKIISSSSELIDFDISENIKKSFEEDNKSVEYSIKGFYHSKRDGLIRKVLGRNIKDEDKLNQHVMDIQKNIHNKMKNMSYSPEFLIRFIICYENNLLTQQGTNQFGAVFESVLILRLKQYVPDEEDFGALSTIIAEICFQAHCKRQYPIEYQTVTDVVNEYNNDFGYQFKVDAVLKYLTDSRIIITNNGDKYIFTDENYFYYYIAKAILSRFNSKVSDRDEYIKNIINRSGFRVDGNILLFLVYLTQDAELLHLILGEINNLYDSWEIFDFDDRMPYLDHDFKAHNIVTEEKIRKIKEEDDALLERNEQRLDEHRKDIVLYSNNDNEIKTLPFALKRAAELLSVVANGLFSFSHLLRKDDKDEWISVLYELPNKIFMKWSTLVETYKNDFVKEYIDEWNAYFSDSDKVGIDPEREAKELLVRISVALLLSLYSASIRKAVNIHNAKFFERGIGDTKTGKLQYLFVLENSGSINVLYNYLKTELKDKDRLYKFILEKIAIHVILHKNKISEIDQQRLISLITKDSKSQSEIMKQRDIIARREKL